MRKENGVLYFKENWFLKNIWGFNVRCFLGLNKDRVFPKNLCSLFWGSLFGIFLMVPMSIIVTAVLIALLTFVIVISGFFGFYSIFFDLIGEKTFYPYKHWRKKRIPVAAWEVCVVISGFYFTIKYGSIAVALMFNSIVAAILIGILAVIGFLVFLFKTTSGKVTREYIKAAKRKVCPLVVIEPRETK